ncbi:MAG: diguanylate cyclase [Planctomycetales bacterium]|jgi:diguanylate cyclase (GGDEF)-like protein/PAS domain S-box-containing protein
MKYILQKLPITVKLAFCVVSLIGSELMVARTLGLIENHENIVMNGRSDLCEAVAIHFSLLAMREDVSTMQKCLHAISVRNDSIESIAVRRATRELLVEVGNHAQNWTPPENGRSTSTSMIVPISSQSERWGSVEVQFKLTQASQWGPWLGDPFVRLMIYMTVVSAIVFYLFFVKILRQLNPAKVIPGRVRSALDTLTEGLLILDSHETIVLANESFGHMAGRSPDAMIGMKVSSLSWKQRRNPDSSEDDSLPWQLAFKNRESATGALFDFEVNDAEHRTLVVNASPIFGPKGGVQGIMTSIEDVTPLERKKRELSMTLDQLRTKSEQIRQQNEELEVLATTDPLTECLNRRSFFTYFEEQWTQATAGGLPISGIMVDSDFFKSINDDFGHSVGDDVLRAIAATLRDSVRLGDLVCRYGGEEFCILLPHTDIDTATAIGEKARVAIEATKFPQLSVTASLGVSSINLGAKEPLDMLDQADKCLYAAKRNGRNQVVRFDQMPEDIEVDEASVSRTQPEESRFESDGNLQVPYRAVAALLSTLAYRHSETAGHSRRVADLCLMAAEGLLSPRDTYTLEIAALLHDIGKIGVPDSILLKNGPLSLDEWEIMRQHDRIGVEIVRASFDCEPVTSIVECYRAHFGGTRNRPGLPSGEGLPVGARVLAIADAYDAMTTDRPYRKALPQEEAFDELRQCGNTQFDPQLVERFITLVLANARPGRDSYAESALSRDAALGIGQHIERLINALETQDFDGMKALATRLHSIAEQDGLPLFAARAERLRDVISADGDLLDILDSANDLIDLCRSTQSAWLRTDESIAVTR